MVLLFSVFLRKTHKNTPVNITTDRHRELLTEIYLRQFRLLCCIKCEGMPKFYLSKLSSINTLKIVEKIQEGLTKQSEKYRVCINILVLLPTGTNRSYGELVLRTYPQLVHGTQVDFYQ